MSVYDIIEDAEHQIAEMTSGDTCRTVRGDECGLDRRVGFLHLCNEECIIVLTCNRGSLDYYGGFEYVHKSEVMTIGRFTIYMREDGNRVDQCFAYMEEKEVREEEGDD